ncbi:winged helix-turn-helix transcriptional regulator [Streptomyces lydicus]|uniref:winged helix-turn-helix transcriptional regulator n=1 Tax=Streptomyces lydicus TaxID=47763 RepID=UPI00370F9011
MAALDLLGRRWTLRILWELRDGTLGFRPLQQRCYGMSSSVLHQRLTELRESRLVERDAGDGYRLTPLGEGGLRRTAGPAPLGRGLGRRTRPGAAGPAGSGVVARPRR